MEQSPGLVVMGGGDSHSKGLGFKSQHRILDGHFFTHICCKNFNVCLKRPKKPKKLFLSDLFGSCLFQDGLLLWLPKSKIEFPWLTFLDQSDPLFGHIVR